MHTLTGRQQRFVDEYLVDLNATAAARRAGYSARTAEQQGYRLLRNAQVAASVADAKQARRERAALTQDRVLHEIGHIAHQDVRRLFDATGHLLPIQRWPDDVAAVVSSVEVLRETTRTVGTTRRRRTVHEEVVKVRFWDKTRALDMEARHLGMFKEIGDPDRPLHAVVRKVTFGGRYKETTP